MPGPNITVEGTPNPNAAKFTVDQTLVEGGSSVSIFNADQVGDNALAGALFGIAGVESLLIAEDFITVTKSNTANWETLVPIIQDAIKEVLS
jgi:hypothetical protein